MSRYLQLEPQQLHVYMYCWRLTADRISRPPPLATGLQSCHLNWDGFDLVKFLPCPDVLISLELRLCYDLRVVVLGSR